MCILCVYVWTSLSEIKLMYVCMYINLHFTYLLTLLYFTYLSMPFRFRVKSLYRTGTDGLMAR